MRRRLLNLLTALSLVLCTTVVALWVLSHWRYVSVRYSKAPDRGFNVAVHHGRVLLSSTVHVPPRPLARSSVSYTSVPLEELPAFVMQYDPAKWRGRLGFLYHIAYHVRGGPFAGEYFDYYGLVMPLWFVAALCAVPPAPFATRVARRGWRSGRRPPQTCPRCGYDLRATPDRCPECGAAPPGAA